MAVEKALLAGVLIQMVTGLAAAIILTAQVLARAQAMGAKAETQKEVETLWALATAL